VLCRVLAASPLLEGRPLALSAKDQGRLKRYVRRAPGRPVAPEPAASAGPRPLPPLPPLPALPLPGQFWAMANGQRSQRNDLRSLFLNFFAVCQRPELAGEWQSRQRRQRRQGRAAGRGFLCHTGSGSGDGKRLRFPGWAALRLAWAWLGPAVPPARAPGHAQAQVGVRPHSAGRRASFVVGLD
jgi:hypothetical protein